MIHLSSYFFEVGLPPVEDFSCHEVQINITYLGSLIYKKDTLIISFEGFDYES